MDKKYYTVAEFAEIMGVSRQSVYKRLSKDLHPFTKILSGQKRISEDAISATMSTHSTHEVNSVNILLSQVIEKDRQLEEKDRQLAEKDIQISKLQDQLTELTKAVREAHTLHAGTLQKELTDESNMEEKYRWWNRWRKKER